jgi:hypothetical protein
VITQRILAGVQNVSRVGLDRIASTTGVDQIVVVTDALGRYKLGLNVFDAEGGIPSRSPSLAP